MPAGKQVPLAKGTALQKNGVDHPGCAGGMAGFRAQCPVVSGTLRRRLPQGEAVIRRI